MVKPNTPPTAQALAEQFQVAELEPRLENSWFTGSDGPEQETPREGWE